MANHEWERLRELLCALGDEIRDRIVAARASDASGELAGVAAETAADTIFKIDRVGEEAVVRFLEARWPRDMPVEIVMEGIEDDHPLTFPAGTPRAATRWKCILDPIDGTRGIMYDKRPAWALAAAAPQRGPSTNLSDIVVAAMTELPVAKQDRADQVSAIAGGGPSAIRSERVQVRSGAREPVLLRPSRASDLRHGFAGLVRFFPEGKALTAAIEEAIWSRMFDLGGTASPLVFEDQYASSGGQVYELLAGRDRMVADLRPLIFRRLGYAKPLACHPYDICVAMILTEAGGVVESPADEGLLRAPLDTTSPVAWVGYANATIARLMRPLLRAALQEHGLVG